MKNGKIYVAGIGPGCEDDITPAVKKAVSVSDVVVGYNYYFSFIQPFVMEGAECVDSGMRKEWDRAQMAFGYAEQGKTVCVISSGDAGIYGMAPLVWEMKRERGSEIEIEVLPGISAFQKAASLLGAPVGHDFCVISLSDLMTPWEKIEKRIEAAAAADFILGDDKLTDDLLAELSHVRDDADELSLLVERREHAERIVESLRIKRSEAFVKKKRVDLDVAACHPGETQRERKACDEGFAA